MSADLLLSAYLQGNIFHRCYLGGTNEPQKAGQDQGQAAQPPSTATWSLSTTSQPQQTMINHVKRENLGGDFKNLNPCIMPFETVTHHHFIEVLHIPWIPRLPLPKIGDGEQRWAEEPKTVARYLRISSSTFYVSLAGLSRCAKGRLSLLGTLGSRSPHSTCRLPDYQDETIT